MSKGTKPTHPSERFHDKYAIDASTGCWIWTAWRNNQGYGTIGISPALSGGPKQVYAHRLSYEMHKGPIPPGLVIDHICNNPACVNPEHLQAITQKANIDRSSHPSVQRRLAGRCIRGHDMTDPTNVYMRPDNGRKACKACYAIRDEAARRKAGKMPAKRGRECGTYSGAIGHYRRGERPCPSCAEAAATYKREYASRRKAS